jgi:hypothetical protein
MLRAIFNVMLYKNKELTEEGKMIGDGDIIEIIEVKDNYVKIHSKTYKDIFYISIGQLIGGFERV